MEILLLLLYIDQINLTDLNYGFLLFFFCKVRKYFKRIGKEEGRIVGGANEEKFLSNINHVIDREKKFFLALVVVIFL